MCKYLMQYTVVNPTTVFVIIIIKMNINKAIKVSLRGACYYSPLRKAMQ